MKNDTNLIKAVLKSVDDLKPLPATVTQTLKLIEQPETAIRDVVAIISLDQALTARILKLANSAFYGFTYPASTLHEAITRLGFRRVKNILLALSYSSLLGRRVAGYNLGHGELWRHSVAVAMVSQYLAKWVGYPAPDEAYVAGLLHDIGKLMLDQFFKMNWDQLLLMGQTRQLSIIEVEEHLFGLNHAEAGGELARKWALPLCLVEAIAYHHRPDWAAEAPKLAAVVHLADIICLRLGVGLTHPDFLPTPSQAALDLLALDVDQIEMLTQTYRHVLHLNSALEECAAPVPVV